MFKNLVFCDSCKTIVNIQMSSALVLTNTIILLNTRRITRIGATFFALAFFPVANSTRTTTLARLVVLVLEQIHRAAAARRRARQRRGLNLAKWFIFSKRERDKTETRTRSHKPVQLSHVRHPQTSFFSIDRGCSVQLKSDSADRKRFGAPMKGDQVSTGRC